jgi:hypothetical protein
LQQAANSARASRYWCRSSRRLAERIREERQARQMASRRAFVKRRTMSNRLDVDSQIEGTGRRSRVTR